MEKSLSRSKPKQPKKNIDKDLAEFLIEVLPKAMQEIRHLNRAGKSEDIPLAHFRVLANIWREPQTNKDLAGAIGLSVAAMSRVISQLENKNLIQREVDSTDGRSNKIMITQKGLSMFLSVRENTANIFTKQIATMTKKDKLELTKGLEHISDIIFAIKK